jgi:hypothetical protein
MEDEGSSRRSQHPVTVLCSRPVEFNPRSLVSGSLNSILILPPPPTRKSRKCVFPSVFQLLGVLHGLSYENSSWACSSQLVRLPDNEGSRHLWNVSQIPRGDIMKHRRGWSSFFLFIWLIIYNYFYGRGLEINLFLRKDKSLFFFY